MTATQLFLDTIAIVAGLSLPFGLWVAVGWIAQEYEYHRIYRNHQAELAAKRGPYTKIVFRSVPNPRMLGIDMYIGDRLAHQYYAEKP